MGKSAYETHTYHPRKDDWGSIGLETKRWHQVWAVNYYGDPDAYSSVMTDDEEFTYPNKPMKCYFLDPNGSERNFNPSGTFQAGFVALVKNIGEETITFDSTGSAQEINEGELGIFMYDGTTWR